MFPHLLPLLTSVYEQYFIHEAFIKASNTLKLTYMMGFNAKNFQDSDLYVGHIVD